MTSSSDDEDPLRRIEDCFERVDELAGSHVHPVTLNGSLYQYNSQLSSDLHIAIEHRPERVRLEK